MPLASIPAFRSLRPAALAAVERGSRPARYDAGATIRAAGTPAGVAVALLTGTAVATHTGTDGREVWLERWTGPTIADKPAVLGDGDPPTGLTAVTAVTARLLPRALFHRLLADEPSVLRHVLGRLADDVHAGHRKLADAVTLPATARLAAWLAAQHDDDVAWRGSQEDLGRLLGLSRVTVNRALARLADAGAVQVTPHGIVVVDRAGLTRA